MNKPIKSTDPAKQAVVNSLKAALEVNKVTEVIQISEYVYSDRCFKSLGNRNYEFVGVFIVEFPFDFHKSNVKKLEVQYE